MVSELTQSLMQNPRTLTYTEKEHYANSMLRSLASSPSMTYQKAFLIAEQHRCVMDELARHVMKNAMLEKYSDKLTYAMGDNPKK